MQDTSSVALVVMMVSILGNSMTIDERLEKLTERHEALTQAVDLLAAMYQQNEQRLAQVLDAINRLANIAEAHDVRLDDHEQNPPDDPSRAA
jgi:DNA-binding transcriptional regulator YbjK